MAGAVQLHGKALSFNNYLDLTAALEAARDFEEPTAIIIKHLNPCGAASADTLAQAFEDAYNSDPVSAYGSVMAFNRVVDLELAENIFNNDWVNETIMPRFFEESGKTDVSVIGTADLDLRSIPGGALAQNRDYECVAPEDFEVVTKAQPTDKQMGSLVFADRVAKHVKSNAIVLVQGTRLVGAGAGQMSRVDSCIIAARKAGERAKGAVLASDAMFPARDGLDAAAATGCAAILQPGGSKYDEEVISAANEHGIPMVMTGMRHFWH